MANVNRISNFTADFFIGERCGRSQENLTWGSNFERFFDDRGVVGIAAKLEA